MNEERKEPQGGEATLIKNKKERTTTRKNKKWRKN